MNKPTTTEMFALVLRHLGFAAQHDRCPPRRLGYERDGTRAVLVLGRNAGGGSTRTGEINAQFFLERRANDAMGHPTWLPLADYPLTLTEKGGRLKVDLQAEDDATRVMVEIVTHLCWGELEDHLRLFWDEHQV